MLLLAIGSIPLASFSQSSSNYFALVSSNTYIHGISKQDFFAGQASYTETTNTSSSNIGGYVYPSNFLGTTKWSFPPRIIINTNAVITINELTTNGSTTIGGFYRVQLYTNLVASPLYDSGDVLWGVVLPIGNPAITRLTITNIFPTNAVNNTNIIMAAIGVKGVNTANAEIAGVSTNWYTVWILGGGIRF